MIEQLRGGHLALEESRLAGLRHAFGAADTIGGGSQAGGLLGQQGGCAELALEC